MDVHGDEWETWWIPFIHIVENLVFLEVKKTNGNMWTYLAKAASMGILSLMDFIMNSLKVDQYQYVLSPQLKQTCI